MKFIRVFKLPGDTLELNKIINGGSVTILDKKVFDPDKFGEVTVYLEYEVDDDD